MKNRKLIQEDLDRFNSILNYGKKLNEDVTEDNAIDPTGGGEFYQTRTGLSPEIEAEIDFELEDLKDEITEIGDRLIAIYTEIEEKYGEEEAKEEFQTFFESLGSSIYNTM